MIGEKQENSCYNQLLKTVERLQYIIEHSINDNKQQYGSLISGLEEVLSVVNNNRRELNAKDEPVSEQETAEHN